MKPVYRTILGLYPWDYRAMFGAEMLEVCGEGHALAELTGLLKGAAVEWFAKLTTDRSIRGRCLPDLRMMRPTGVPREVWFASPRHRTPSHSEWADE